MSRWRRQQQKRARNGRRKVARVGVLTEARRYTPVLQRMTEIMRKNRKMTFGAALDKAAGDVGITVPKRMVPALLTAALKIAVA